MWVKLDDGFTENLKIDGLTDAAFRLHVSALVFCGKNLTDGFVPLARVHRLTPTHSPEVVAELVAADLWHPVEEGYELHDFLDYNPTAAEVKAKREARVEAGKKGGKESGRTRRQASAEANAEANASPNAQAKSKQRGSTPSRPVPSRPVQPSTSVENSSPSSIYRGVKLDDVWKHMADAEVKDRRRDYEAGNEGAKIGNEVGWRATVMADYAERLTIEAMAILDAYDCDAYAVAQVIRGEREKRNLQKRREAS